MQISARLVKFFWVCMLAVSPTACSLAGAAIPRPQPGTETVSAPTEQASLQSLFVPQSDAMIEPVNASALTPSNLVTFSGVNGFVWLPNGSGMALASQQGIALVEATGDAAIIQGATPPQAQTVPSETPSMLTTANKTAVVAWTSEGDTINVMNASQGATDPIRIHSAAPVTGLALAPSADKAAYATVDRLVFTFEPGDSQNTQSWATPAWLANLSYSPDGSQLAGVDPGNSTLYLLDAKTGHGLRSLEWLESITPGLHGVYLNPDWSMAAWVSQGVVQLMNVSDGTRGPMLLHQDAVNAVAWSPDGHLLASSAAEMAGGQFEPVVFLWDVQTGDLLIKLVQPTPVNSLGFSPDGRQLAVLNTDGGLQTWSVSR
jgi:WD40 repeat protein